MGYKAKRFGVSKVDLGDSGYWVELRPISKGEAEDFQTTATDDKARSDAGEEMLVRMIARWNLDDEDGAAIPISRDAVRDLSLEDYGTLTAAITKVLNPLADAVTAKK